MLKKGSFQVLLFFCFLFALHPSGKKEVSDIEQNGKSEKALYIISLPESGDLHGGGAPGPYGRRGLGESQEAQHLLRAGKASNPPVRAAAFRCLRSTARRGKGRKYANRMRI